MIRAFTPTDINDHTARLIYTTDDELFPFVFGKEDKALPRLKTLMALQNNSFSYRHGLMDEEVGNARGVLVSYSPTAIDPKLEEQDFLQAFTGTGAQVFLQLKAWLLEAFIDKPSMGDLYLQNICVLPECRGKGIGAALIQTRLDQARKQGQQIVSLDVTPHNPAKRLYERLGFKHSKTLRIPLTGDKLERMQLKL